jgi:cell division protein FtsN
MGIIGRYFGIKQEWLVWAVILVVIFVVFVMMTSRQEPEEFISFHEIISDSTLPSMSVTETPVNQELPTTSLPSAPESVTPPVSVTTPASATPPPSVSEMTEEYYAIQVHSFKDKNKAESALADLQKKAYPAAQIITKDLGAKGTWYRVFVGQFKSKQEAESYFKEFQKSYKDSLIIRHKGR